MNNMFLIFIFITLPSITFANAYFCSNPVLEELPILAEGRVKPLLVHAQERIKYLSGKSSFDKKSATEVFCQLSFQGLGLPDSIHLTMPIEHVEVKKILNLDQKEKTQTYSTLLEQRLELTKHLRPNEAQGGLQKELQKILGRLNLYESITQGMDWQVFENAPIDHNQKNQWRPLAEALKEETLAALSTTNSDPFIAYFKERKSLYDSTSPTKYLWELKFAKLHLFAWALTMTLLALFFWVLFKSPWPGTTLTGVTVLIQLIGVALRVYISGRAPITNMYETVMFSGLGALILGLALALIRQEKIFVLVGLAYNFLCLLMMNFAHGMLSPAISPLVPVLRDNFWLSTHVTSVILSYSALALSWILANIVLVKKRLKKLSPQEESRYTDLVYAAIKWGVVLLAGGIILGGVWADYSWGRFWGWDPKETWSLIVLLIYMAILHGQYTSWIPKKRFITLVAAAFLSVLMAWFGVNYILASGLHSYGFSEGGALFLATMFVLQLGLIALCEFSGRQKQKLP